MAVLWKERGILVQVSSLPRWPLKAPPFLPTPSCFSLIVQFSFISVSHERPLQKPS